VSAASPTPPPTPHRRSIESLRERHGSRYRWRVLITVMVGTMASIMASTIINVAVPDLSREFGLGQERAQWLSAGFMAAMTISMLATPWLLERFGYHRTYVASIAVLMAGGIGGGLGTSFDWVLAMRVLEGLSAGVLQPIPAVIVLHAFAREEQGRAMGIFGFGVVLAPAIGPSIGGVLVDTFGWRAIFFVVVPFCIASLVMAHRYLPHSAPGGAQVNTHGRRFDFTGLALVAVFVLALLNGLVHLHSASTAPAIVLLGLALATFAAFVVQQRRTPHALMAPRLFGFREFSMGGCVAFIYGMALFGSTYLVPVFMQLALKLPASQAGAVLFPAGLALAATIPQAGRMADRFAVHRVLSAGLVLLALSFLLMVTVGLSTALWVITAWAVVGRIGLGLVLPSLNLGSVRPLPLELVSHGSSGISFLRQLGGAVGVSVVGIVLEWRLRVHHDDPLRGFHETFVMLGVISACAVLAAWRMRPHEASGDGGAGS
jgi:EmrB/QacA subfamily drug resistance transporter